ncbi:MAG: class I SAM-dependent methyltransferase [Rhodobacteraceae bacterium]|nr:MAG: class I SAM-dependent methyltransferase [Paracoccaceae bacterium]
MTALKAALLRQIRAQGPLSITEYMTQCLLHPEHGYYATRDPLGEAGDFTTAPEVSQIFGEMLGLLLAQVWIDQGAPAPFTLAELGPGRGTLLADALRATARVPRFHESLDLHLVEASAPFRAAQAARLGEFSPIWHDTADSLPDQPLFLIANEFFDALPIRQFQRQGNAWAERMVGASGDALVMGLAPPAPLAALAHRLDDTEEGQIVETCAPARTVIEALRDRITAHGGFALIIDYGDWRSLGDTLQALRAHRFDDPLAHPGMADLTAHVDFEALAQTAQPLRTTQLTPQGYLLERLGITQRAEALARRLGGAALQSHIAAHRRLTHPEEMGHLFKAMGLFPSSAPLPPGFDP